jgi:hypothetical protein
MAEITHYCQRCGEDLSEAWPYALGEACAEQPCPHGNKHGACDHCDVESDRTYDAGREAAGPVPVDYERSVRRG